MVLCLRDTGNIPWWLRQQDLNELHYSTAPGGEAFVAFWSDTPGRGMVFSPRAPAYGPRAIAAHDPGFEVLRIVRVMNDVCFASLDVRRAIQIREVGDASAAAYLRRREMESQSGQSDQVGERMRSFRAENGERTPSQGALSCPLPKEQLANVWMQVQEELRARCEVAQNAAIPITERNARAVCLSREQIHFLASQLEEEREGLDDIVGMPLERAQRMRPTEGGGGLGLATPQFFDGFREGNSSQQLSTGGSASDGSSYHTPGARYLTPMDNGEDEKDSAGNCGGEPTVNAIIDESMLAMKKK
ncbi:unnamed protein product [Phytomonas sp. Hart1]|nr:unnamed protein product [Phytomonas sp. Hart1]|eukprot:CCW71994.1 unnamed protein product [Phytomonas sp. isolate Hart1]